VINKGKKVVARCTNDFAKNRSQHRASAILAEPS